MGELGPTVPYYATVLLWLGRTAFFAAVCGGLILLGIRILDALTPRIHERKKYIFSSNRGIPRATR